MVVERGDVADDVAGDEPQPVHVEDAEGLGSALPARQQLPGVAGDQELVARHVERIEGDPEQLALAGVELGVDQHPALRALVPVFGHPMVDELALLEVGAEAAAGPRRARPARRSMATCSRVKCRQTPTSRSPAGRACRQRPRVVRHDAVEHLLDRADMRPRRAARPLRVTP